MSFSLSKWICDRCDKEFESYDYSLLCCECEDLINSLNCGGCEFLRDYGLDYTYCDLRKCSVVDLSYDCIEFCKNYKITSR